MPRRCAATLSGAYYLIPAINNSGLYLGHTKSDWLHASLGLRWLHGGRRFSLRSTSKRNGKLKLHPNFELKLKIECSVETKKCLTFTVRVFLLSYFCDLPLLYNGEVKNKLTNNFFPTLFAFNFTVFKTVKYLNRLSMILIRIGVGRKIPGCVPCGVSWRISAFRNPFLQRQVEISLRPPSNFYTSIKYYSCTYTSISKNTYTSWVVATSFTPLVNERVSLKSSVDLQQVFCGNLFFFVYCCWSFFNLKLQES